MKKILILILLPMASFAAESMPSMPMLKVKKIITVTVEDQFDDEIGFGEQEENTKMMNLMMVEGSGIEGMDHSQGHHHQHQK